MAEVLNVVEEYLKKIAGEVLEFKINYEKLPPFFADSEKCSLFWKNVSEFIHKMQELVDKNTRNEKGAEEISRNLDVTKSIDKKVHQIERQYLDKFNPSLVQITADKGEIDRRIAAFLRKKRTDVDVQNQREFCNLLNTENVTNTEKENNIMESDDIKVDTILHSLPTKRQKTESMKHLSQSVEERFRNIETHLNVEPAVQCDIYDRLKKIEERILYLEGISPEYFTYKEQNISKQQIRNQIQESSDDDLDKRMSELKEKLLSEKSTMHLTSKASNRIEKT